MGFFVFLFFILLAAGGTWVWGSIVGNEKTDARGNARTTNNATIAHAGAVVGAIVLILILFGVRSVTTIDPGHIGIKKSFGKLVGTTGNGWIVHSPWSSVQSLSVQNELRVYDMTSSNSAVTADSQPVFLTVQVNYQVERGKAVDLYQSTGGQFVDRVLDPNVFQFTKEVTAEYTATQFAQNREAIRSKIERHLSTALEKQGIQINNVSLKNVQFTPALQAAIERTVEATQNAKREEAQVRVVEAQANQRVARAKGLAKATLAQAQADSKAQKLRQKTLTPLLVQQQAINKLNPNVSVIVCTIGQSCIPQAVLATAGK